MWNGDAYHQLLGHNGCEGAHSEDQMASRSRFIGVEEGEGGGKGPPHFY